MKEKYKYLTKNVLIFAVSSFGTKFLSFLLVPFYTSVLTTAEYGIADIITTTATLMMYICTVNIADAVLRFAIERKKDQCEILFSFDCKPNEKRIKVRSWYLESVYFSSEALLPFYF